jgi:lipoprotein-anchoring transpeptidase ErfK/SrfK
MTEAETLVTETLELPDGLSRREFFRLSGMSLLALAVPGRWARPQIEVPAGQFGRVVDPTVDVHQGPSFGSEKVKTFWRDDILELEGAVVGDRIPEHNRVWYQVKGVGYAHSSSIQPVRKELNEPLTYVPYSGVLMEVTVPYVDVYWRPRTDSERAYRFYYATTYWIDGVSRDSNLRLWYRIFDDKYTYHYYARAEAFRPIPLAELTPISHDVPAQEKRITVDLTRQWVQCFEGSQPIFTTKVSTGRKFDDGVYWTPQGEFITFRKRPSRHMAVGNLASGYDLPGVPWVAYITEDGVAFHGTYWHNDFGTPRSHGCINMTPQAAKWLYRWTQPLVPTNEQEVWVNYGTAALVTL